MKTSIVLMFSDSVKTCKSPHVEDWKCSLVLIFNLMVGRIKANRAETFFAETAGTLIPISSHWSPELRSEKKATQEQKQGCRNLHGSWSSAVFAHLVLSLTLQYSNTHVNSNLIYLLFLFCHPSKVEVIPLFPPHLCAERNQLIQPFLRNTRHISPETNKEEMNSLFLAHFQNKSEYYRAEKKRESHIKQKLTHNRSCATFSYQCRSLSPLGQPSQTNNIAKTCVYPALP